MYMSAVVLFLQAQCSCHTHLRTALELVAEMRSRDVRLNTHTYTALLNVCVKANELDLALDIFNQVSTMLLNTMWVSYACLCRG